MELTFGEQIKIILKRKNMTIRQLAEMIEVQTGKPMSRQNLTQKLNRDNFQEQDMKEIAQALGCFVQISVIDPMEATVASLQALMPQGMEGEETASKAAAAQTVPGLSSGQASRLTASGKTAAVRAGSGSRGAGRLLSERPASTRANARTAAADVPAADGPVPANAAAFVKGPVSGAAFLADENDVDSDVLREMELALMESIQNEMYGGAGRASETAPAEAVPAEEVPSEEAPAQKAAPEEAPSGKAPVEEPVRVNAKWQEEALARWSQEQDELERREDAERLLEPAAVEDEISEPESVEPEFVEPEPVESEEYEAVDSLSWARQKPSVWPMLTVPGEEADPGRRGGSGTERKTGSEEAAKPVVSEDADLETVDPETANPERLDLETIEEEDALYTPEEPDDLEFFDLDELEGGDISGVSRPYTLSRETQPESREAQPESRGGEAEQESGEISAEELPFGESFASAPYVIPRAPEQEEKKEEGFFVDIPLDELPQRPMDDAEDTVQEYDVPKEPDMEEKIASWDAAVKRRLGRPILMSPEERRVKRAAKEAAARAGAEEEKKKPVPDIDPRTGKEYETNTVKHHPTKPDMLLVYDQEEHMWVEQAERAFTNFQIRKRAMLGKDYEPPVYLD